MMKPVKKARLAFDNLKVHHFPWILAVVMVILITAGAFVYWQVEEMIEKAIAERLATREMTLARSGALAISEFFQSRKTRLLLLSEIESIKAGKEREGRKVLDLLIARLNKGEVVAGVARVDKEGKLIWIANRENNRENEGISLADREYFIWAKEQKEPGKVFINKPLVSRAGTTKGKWVTIMATPVFYQDEFNGLALFVFPIEDLSKKYVNSLASSLAVQVLIVTQEGGVIASNIPEAIGTNILKYVQQGEWKEKEELLAMTKKALAGKGGSLVHDHYLFAPENKQMRMITTYTPIRIGDQLWSLWLSTPFEKAKRLASPISTIQTKGFVFSLIGSLILVLTFVLGLRIAQRDAFIDGFKRGRDSR